jgi:hypothetical protein
MSDPLVRATVGPGGDFDLQSQDAGDWAQPVWRALTGSSPKRWLVFTGSAYHFHSPVNLNNVPGSHYLRLEGGGIGVTRIIRSFDGAAGTPSSGIFFSSEWDSSGTADHWQLFFTGIEFDGNRNSHVGNCCNFGPLDFCYFENCGFNNASGDGFSAGVGMVMPGKQVTALRFINCAFSSNSGNGLSLVKAGDVTVYGGAARSNGNAGIHYEAQVNRGASSVAAVHFEGSPYAAWVQGARAARIMNCMIENTNVVFQATESCMFENNLLVNSSFSDNGINTVCAFNYPNTAC